MAAVPELGRAAGVEPRVAPEAAATHDLYERYSRQIYGFCLNQLGNREEAEDAAQTTFLNAFRGLQRGISPEAESAWLFKIAHNVCLTRRRSSYRRGRVESPGDMQALQDFVAAPQRMETDELIELQEALAGMPSNQRKAILLREWRGLSYREIADEMEVSQAAVETLIFRARRSLAQGLEQPPKEKSVWRRLRHGVDVGSLVATAKATLAGSAAVKAVATATAVTATAGVVATVPSNDPADRHRRPAVERPVAPAPAADKPLAPTAVAGAVAPSTRGVDPVEQRALRAPRPTVERKPEPRRPKANAKPKPKTKPAPVAAPPAAAVAEAPAPAPVAAVEPPAPAPAREEPKAAPKEKPARDEDRRGPSSSQPERPKADKRGESPKHEERGNKGRGSEAKAEPPAPAPVAAEQPKDNQGKSDETPSAEQPRDEGPSGKGPKHEDAPAADDSSGQGSSGQGSRGGDDKSGKHG